MTGKIILMFFVGILLSIVLGGLAGNYISSRKTQISTPAAIPVKSVEPTLPPSITLTPFPTTPPLPNKVKSIDDRYIVITSTQGGGDMYEPKDPSHLTVFKMKNGQRTPATFNDVKVGQSVNLTIIIPGKQAELVIEE